MISVAPPGLDLFSIQVPTAHAVGYDSCAPPALSS